MTSHEADAHDAPTDLPSGVVTFVFTDIEGSTTLLRRLGQRFHELLEEHDRLLRAAFLARGGVVVKTAGDSFFVAFSDASEAVEAAADAQRAIRAHHWPDDGPIRVRIGIHSGEATPRAGDYVALAVNQAARVSAAAHGDQVILTDVTAALVDMTGAGDALRDLGRFRVRDFAEPVRLFQLSHPSLPSVFPPLRVAPERATNLPRFRTSFLGRRELLDVLCAKVAPGRLVTLVGPGGVGKTRAAVEAASGLLDTFEAGVWFTDLSTVDHEGVLAAITGTVKMAGNAGHTDEDPMVALAAKLKNGPLLVLDNCEHVVDVAAAIADDLLHRAPALAIMATSREPLRIDDELVLRVDPLESPDRAPRDLASLLATDAGRLFVERAARVRTDIDVEDHLDAISEIIGRLDGLPLAIELAVARLSDMSIDALRERLRSRLSVLRSVSRSTGARHHTLEATIAWSYELLPPDAARVFRALSVFSSWFDEDDVLALYPGRTAVDDVWRLTDVSLLVTEEHDARIRFRMLESVREFASERLAEHGSESEDAASAHTRWCAALAHASTRVLDAGSERRWEPVVVERQDDLRVAAARSAAREDAQTSLVLTLALCQHVSSIPRTKAIEMLDRALAAATAPTLERARALRVLGILGFAAGHERGLSSRTKEAVDLARQHGDANLEARCLNNLGAFARGEGDYEESARCHASALAIARKHELVEVEASSLMHIGLIARMRGDLDAAARSYEEAYELARRLEDPGLTISALTRMGGVAYAADDAERSYAMSEEALRVARASGSPGGAAQALAGMGYAAAALGDLERAEAQLSEALTLARDAESRSEASLLIGLAWCDYKRGRIASSAERLRSALTVSLERQGDVPFAILLLAGLLAHLAGEERLGLRLAATAVMNAKSLGVEPDPPEARALSETFGELGADDAVDLARATTEALELVTALREHPG